MQFHLDAVPSFFVRYDRSSLLRPRAELRTFPCNLCPFHNIHNIRSFLPFFLRRPSFVEADFTEYILVCAVLVLALTSLLVPLPQCRSRHPDVPASFRPIPIPLASTNYRSTDQPVHNVAVSCTALTCSLSFSTSRLTHLSTVNTSPIGTFALDHQGMLDTFTEASIRPRQYLALSLADTILQMRGETSRATARSKCGRDGQLLAPLWPFSPR